MDSTLEESEYRWLDAAKSYERKLQDTTDDVFLAAKCWQKIGFCLNLASRQAKNLKDFKELRHQAVASYKTAAELYSRKSTTEMNAKSKECLAIASYLNSWLVPQSFEREKLLNKCLVLGKEACESLRRQDDETSAGTMCNLLSLCLLDLLRITPTSEQKRTLVQDAIDEATKAISSFSDSDNKDELLVAFSMASLLSWYSANISDDEVERKEIIDKCLRFSKEALALCDSVSDLYSKSISLWAGALSTLYFTETIESSAEFAKKMLEYASAIRDNYFKGIALYLLAHITDWKIELEADQDRKKHDYEQTIKYANESTRYLELVCQDSIIADTHLYSVQSYSSLAREFAVHPKEKLGFARKAVRIGEKGLKHAFRSGSPDSLGSILHALSKAFQYYSKLESKKEERIGLLEEALNCRQLFITTVERAFPSNLWTSGVGLVYAAQIEADLAELKKEYKTNLLKDALSHIGQGVLRCNKWIASRNVPSLIAIVAGFEAVYGTLLGEYYSSTGDMENLSKANRVYGDAAEKFKRIDMPSRVAESYWRIAGNLDITDDHQKAAWNFENAFAGYKAAAQKIPEFSDFYLACAGYMKSWSEIQMAKLAHESDDYSGAMQHYEKASGLLKQSMPWDYLSSNFHAWAHIELAEDLSRKERSQDAVKSFEQAIRLFQISEKILRSQLARIDRIDEKDLVSRLIEASDTRQEYGHGRILIEEAKILDKKGDHTSSSDKYEAAAATFLKISQAGSSQIRKEIMPLIYLCQAWQKTTLAEVRSSPILYEEAAELFKQANIHTFSESASLLALAHSSFCRALEHGTEFEVTRNRAMYVEAKKHLDIAANYYLRAGFEAASEYAKATQRLFDAYVFMDDAKKETDPDKEAKFYVMAEKVLQMSVDSYNKANHSEKTSQVQKLLQKVKEERELATSLSEVLHAPVATSSTASFATISLSEEKAVGLERFDHADIQAKLVSFGDDFRVGESLKFGVRIVNVGKEAVLLTKIEDFVPPGFQVTGKQNFGSIEGSALHMKANSLQPLAMKDITLTFKPFMKGSFEICPKIFCVDESGRQMLNEPEPKVLRVLEALLPGRMSTGYDDLDNLLFGGIPENYAVVLTSPSCDERELLVKAFLTAGVKLGQMTFYVTAEPGEAKVMAERYPSSFYLFVCNPRAELLFKDLPNIFKLKGVESLTDIDIALVKGLRTLDPCEKGSRRACIEIVSDVLLQHHAVITRKWLSGVLSDLKAQGFTTLAVVNPHMHLQEEVQAILGLFEGEIRISEKETAQGAERILRVRKMYSQRYLDNEIVLERERLKF